MPGILSTWDKDVIFSTVVTNQTDLDSAYLLLKSKRAFAGALCDSPFLIYSTIDIRNTYNEFQETIPISIEEPQSLAGCLFATKVLACRMAEESARKYDKTLIWIDPACLLLRPPAELVLQPPFRAAFRPVHISNIGQPAGEQLSAYWKYIYDQSGGRVPDYTVTSFVDARKILPYFNSHCFSLDPNSGLCSIWMSKLEEIWKDKPFIQSLVEPAQRIFLFQAVLSAIITSKLTQDEIRILSPDYSYPYHMQQKIPPAEQAGRMNELTCVVYEEESIHPDDLINIRVDEPLSSWLRDNLNLR